MAGLQSSNKATKGQLNENPLTVAQSFQNDAESSDVGSSPNKPKYVKCRPELTRKDCNMLGGKGEHLDSNDNDSDSDYDIKEEQENDDSSNKDRVKQLKQNLGMNSFDYQRVLVQNYDMEIVEEEPIENIKDIFRENCLEYEKQQHHQQIFENIFENTDKIDLEQLQTLYLTRLRRAANLQIFTCSLCNYQTMKLINLKCHLLILHNTKIESEVFQCNKCDYKTNFQSYITRHSTTHTKVKLIKTRKTIETKYPCVECNFEGRSEDGLQRHIKTHHTDRTRCDLCSFESKNKQAMKEHKDTHKSGRKFICYKCDYKNNCKITLALHLVNVHNIANEASKKSKICEICSSSFSNINLLRRHYIMHKSINELDETEIHKCSECGYQTKYKTSLKGHMVIHKPPEYICEVCGFATKHKKNYEEHLVTHKKLSEIEWFRCDICPYQARNKKLLAKHIKKGDHSGKRLLHIRNRDRIREAEENGEDISVIIKKYRIRKLNGVQIRSGRIKRPSKCTKRKRKPQRKDPVEENVTDGYEQPNFHLLSS